jgi:hypothetical protein
MTGPVVPDRLRVALLAIVACVACSGPPDTPPIEPIDAAAMAPTWPMEMALSDSVDPRDLLASGERWLGLAEPAQWRPPGESPVGVTAPLAVRWRQEDRQAIQLLRRLDLSVQCRLGTQPGAFGEEVPEGWAAAELACRMLGDEDAARRSAELRVEAGLPAPTELAAVRQTGTVPELLSPAVDRHLEIAGETLRYRFVLAPQWEFALAALAHESTPAGLAGRVGTSRWDEAGSLPGAAILLEAGGSDSRRLARLERDAEEQVARWRSSLDQKTEPTAELDSGSRALLIDWIRRAIYRDLGLAELAADRPDVALSLLEEATGARARPGPGPGLDPLLLSAFAKARYEAGEVQGAAELLTRMAAQPGWQWVGALAEGVARVAVLPSVTASEVRR